MTIICPYCDGDRGVMRETVRTKEEDEQYTVIKRCVCKDCAEVFYAVKQYKQTGPFDYIRRDQLEPMTGIRIRRAVISPRGHRA